jgi:hypothetical protein
MALASGLLGFRIGSLEFQLYPNDLSSEWQSRLTCLETIQESGIRNQTSDFRHQAPSTNTSQPSTINCQHLTSLSRGLLVGSAAGANVEPLSSTAPAVYQCRAVVLNCSGCSINQHISTINHPLRRRSAVADPPLCAPPRPTLDFLGHEFPERFSIARNHASISLSDRRCFSWIWIAGASFSFGNCKFCFEWPTTSNEGGSS